jgi:hypothetical protein
LNSNIFGRSSDPLFSCSSHGIIRTDTEASQHINMRVKMSETGGFTRQPDDGVDTCERRSAILNGDLEGKDKRVGAKGSKNKNK